MGCDIHFYVERRENGVWLTCDDWATLANTDWVEDVIPGAEFYSGRNYDLFAILANVRNGSGFAGLPTGEGFNVIAMPRGLPDGLSPKLAERAEHDLEPHACHTPTWLLLSEIEAFDWEQTTEKSGFIAGPAFDERYQNRRNIGLGPLEHSAAIGPDVNRVSKAAMLARIKRLKARYPPQRWRLRLREKLEHVYCYMSWKVTYRDRAEFFLTDTVPRMRKLGEPDDVRCVFWFDN